MNKSTVGELIESSLSSGNGVIPEDRAKRIFSACGIPVVAERAVDPDGDPGAAAAEIGFPVVLKGCGSRILHKTDAGLVRVGLASPSEVRQAAGEMIARAGADLTSFLLQPQLQGTRELVAGVFRDPLFGPVVLFGLGGIHTEVLNDTVLRIAPLSESLIEEMFAELRAKALLGAYRGARPVNLEAMKRILMALSDLAVNHPAIKEIDINPILIDREGEPVAVDGLIIVDRDRGEVGRRPPIDTRAFKACYYPKTVAIIGASGTLTKWGNSVTANILSRDFQGQVYLVNPRGGELMGRPVYRSITAIDQPVDLAVVTIPAAKVLDLIPELRQKGVKAMLLITSGFRETGGDGAALEARLVEAAEEAGVVIFGPNTMGICNPWIDFFCSGVHVYPHPGGTALVCQSGNMGTQLLAFAEQQDIGIRAFSGSGNEAMVTIEDYIQVFEDDDKTSTVVLYVESIKDGKRFFECARRVSRKKPVIILKGGRTGKGSAAAASHTGAIASDHRVFAAACRQAGIVQVQQPMELLDLSAAFSSLPLPKGNRVAIMTLGGGWGVIATDLCLENDLSVPDLPPAIIDRLSALLPAYWSHGNPVDIVGENDPNIPRTALEELLKWDGCDAVIHLGIHGRSILGGRMLDSVGQSDPAYPSARIEAIKKMVAAMEADYIRHVVALTERYHKPVVGVSLVTNEDTRTVYRFADCRYQGVFFPSPERAVKALAGMFHYQQWLAGARQP